MNKRTSFLALTALLLGVVFVAFMPPSFFESVFKKKNEEKKMSSFFTIREVIGRAENISPTPPEILATNSPIAPLNVLITHADSKILLSLETKGEIWVFPFSKVELLVDADGNPELHLVYGEIKKSSGSTISAFYRGALIQNDEFSTVQEALISEVPVMNETTFKDLSLKESAPQNILEKQIFETLSVHKRFFQSCLIKFYKKENGKVNGGETVFDLLISPNGVIEKSVVTRTEIKSSEYLACLEQVLSRVRFKGLTIKEPVHAVFPLNIEL